MRKQAYTLDKVFRQGLRSDSRSDVNTQLLTECYGFKPREEGLLLVDTLTSPFSEGAVGSSFSSQRKLVDLVLDASRADDSDWTVEASPQWAYDAGNLEFDRTPGSGAEILGSELLVGNDINFDAGGDGNWVSTNATYWTTDPTSGDGGTACLRVKGTTGAGGWGIADTNFSAVLKNATSYRVTFNVLSVVGTLPLYADIVGAATYSGDEINFSAPGTYTTVITTDTVVGQGATLRIRKNTTAGAGNTCYIDTVSIKEIIGYEPTGADTLRLADAQLSAPLVVGRTYYLTFTVDNYSAGSVTADLGGTAGTACTADGDYFQAIVAGDDATGLTFIANTAFNGSVELSNVHIYYLDDSSLEWPFPQLFRGDAVTLIAGKDWLGTIAETNWIVTTVITYDALTPSTPKAITAGGAWNFVDFGPNWALYNGACVIFYKASDAKVYVYDDTSISTGCKHRGRSIMAGFDQWPETWEDAFQKLATADTVISHSLNTALSGRWVMWSAIGKGFGGSPWWLLDAEAALVASNGYTSGPLTIQALRENTWGFAPMPFRDTILRTEAHGKAVIVYGTDGVTALPLALAESGLSTYGVLPLLRGIGLKYRGALGTKMPDSDTQAEHLFLDQHGSLWQIGIDLKPKYLGYREFFSAMTKPVITYDPKEDEYRICDGTVGYVLTRQGLGQARQGWVSSIIEADTDKVYASTDPAEVTDADCAFTIDRFDCGVSGIKTVSSVLLGFRKLTNLTASLGYIYNPDDDFEFIDTRAVNPQGTAEPTAAGIEFQLRVTGTPSANARVSHASIEWESTDRRFAHTEPQQ